MLVQLGDISDLSLNSTDYKTNQNIYQTQLHLRNKQHPCSSIYRIQKAALLDFKKRQKDKKIKGKVFLLTEPSCENV